MPDQQPKYQYDGISSAGIARAAALFWPDWVEVDGCVLRADVADAKNVRRWLSVQGGSVQQVEWALNHVHLYDEVEEGWEEPPQLLNERLLEVARRLADAWRASLAAAFPERTFDVEVATPAEDHGPSVYVVSSNSAAAACRHRRSGS